jgi:hypothetical protein
MLKSKGENLLAVSSAITATPVFSAQSSAGQPTTDGQWIQDDAKDIVEPPEPQPAPDIIETPLLRDKEGDYYHVGDEDEEDDQ